MVMHIPHLLMRCHGDVLSYINTSCRLTSTSGESSRRVFYKMMAKPTTIKDAIKKFEEKFKVNSTEAREVNLQFQWLPIEKMDNSLGQLTRCERLSLSTNMIEKITGLSGLRNLKILSLGRNYIKAFSGLEPVAESLEELWLSYNLIEKMKGVGILRKLKVLYMSNNLVKDWTEFNKLQECPALVDLLFVGNPLCDTGEEGSWRTEAIKRLPNLKKLDGEPVIHDFVATELNKAVVIS